MYIYIHQDATFDFDSEKKNIVQKGKSLSVYRSHTQPIILGRKYHKPINLHNMVFSVTPPEP